MKHLLYALVILGITTSSISVTLACGTANTDINIVQPINLNSIEFENLNDNMSDQKIKDSIENSIISEATNATINIDFEIKIKRSESIAIISSLPNSELVTGNKELENIKATNQINLDYIEFEKLSDDMNFKK